VFISSPYFLWLHSLKSSRKKPTPPPPRYNALFDEESAEDAREESGWKLVFADVFRPPQRASLLAVMVGGGLQVVVMAGATLAFAVLGVLSPSNRGGLMVAVLMLFVLMGLN
jgi:transmembrane 9 superfamily member 2/4